MAQRRKVTLSLPEEFVKTLDVMAKQSGMSRTGFICAVLQERLQSEHAHLLHEQLKSGYAEMGKINLELANMCFDADTEAWQTSEENLSESE